MNEALDRQQNSKRCKMCADQNMAAHNRPLALAQTVLVFIKKINIISALKPVLLSSPKEFSKACQGYALKKSL